MTFGPNFFPKIVKIKGIIPKFHFFQKKKKSKICCSQNKSKSKRAVNKSTIKNNICLILLTNSGFHPF